MADLFLWYLQIWSELLSARSSELVRKIDLSFLYLYHHDWHSSIVPMDFYFWKVCSPRPLIFQFLLSPFQCILVENLEIRVRSSARNVLLFLFIESLFLRNRDLLLGLVHLLHLLFLLFFWDDCWSFQVIFVGSQYYYTALTPILCCMKLTLVSILHWRAPLISTVFYCGHLLVLLHYSGAFYFFLVLAYWREWHLVEFPVSYIFFLGLSDLSFLSWRRERI